MSTPRKRHAFSTLAAGLLALALPPGALAADCSVSSAIVNFGTYDPLASSDNSSNGSVRINCRKTAVGLTETVAVSVQLQPSPPGANGARRLLLGGSELSFDLFTDLLLLRPWGDGNGSTGVLAGVLVLTSLTPNANLDLPVFGRMVARQPVAVGTYNGSFTITVNF